jgi:hypothetical protein
MHASSALAGMTPSIRSSFCTNVHTTLGRIYIYFKIVFQSTPRSRTWFLSCYAVCYAAAAKSSHLIHFGKHDAQNIYLPQPLMLIQVGTS